MQVESHTQSAPSDKPTEATQEREVPRRKGHWFWGSTIDFQNDQIAFVQNIKKEYGDVSRTRIVNSDWYFVYDPEIIHEINVRQAKIFVKPKLAKMIWSLFLGPTSILTQQGAPWDRQHEMIKPGFHRFRIDAYAPVMVEYIQRMVSSFKDGEVRDFREDINNSALEIVGKTLFDTDMGGDTNVVFDAMHNISEMLVEHINLPLPTPRWWPSPGNRRKIGAIEALEGVITRLVAERKSDGKDRGDLLSTVVFAKDENGVAMNAQEVRDQMMTLIFAGHETTAHSLTWAYYLLAKNPDKAQKLYEEVKAVVGDRPLEVADLDKLPYLAQVVKETLRLNPAVWTYMRAPTEDVVIKGYRFPKECYIFISQYVMGRDERFHPNPLKFEPERWTREYERNLPKGSYVPFAAGPRVCLGQGFAQMEMKLVLGTLIQNVVSRLADGFEPDFMPELSLHPGKRGLQTKVEFRADAPLRKLQA